MKNPHLVDVLPARARRARKLDVDVARVDLDVDVVHLGHDRHRGRARVHAALKNVEQHTYCTQRMTDGERVNVANVGAERRLCRVNAGSKNIGPHNHRGLARVHAAPIYRSPPPPPPKLTSGTAATTKA